MRRTFKLKDLHRKQIRKDLKSRFSYYRAPPLYTRFGVLVQILEKVLPPEGPLSLSHNLFSLLLADQLSFHQHQL